MATAEHHLSAHPDTARFTPELVSGSAGVLVACLAALHVVRTDLSPSSHVLARASAGE